ncbi:YqzL family protein [Numidum massiliense]|nr:YqzL family protein [Numidum massiliense]
MHDFIWNVFRATGNIDTYLLYKDSLETENVQDQAEEKTDPDPGPLLKP